VEVLLKKLEHRGKAMRLWELPVRSPRRRASRSIQLATPLGISATSISDNEMATQKTVVVTGKPRRSQGRTQLTRQGPAVSWVELSWRSSERLATMVPPLLLGQRVKLTAVLALAWTRADKDKSYTKLDLMDEPSVEKFFEQNQVDGEVHGSVRLTTS